MSPFVKEFTGVLIPVLMMIVLHLTTNIIDGFFIGNFVGEIALAGVQFVAPVMSMIFATSLVIASGCATMVGIAIGAKKDDDANQAFAHGWFCCLLLSFLLMIVGTWGIEWILNLLNATPVIWNDSHDYLAIRLKYSGFFAGLVLLESALRNDGQAKQASCCVAFGALINLICTYFFVKNWGVSGVAAATILSEVLTVLMMVVLILRKKGVLQFVKPIWNVKQIWNIVYNGSSDGMTGVSNSIVFYAFNLTLLENFGELGVASYAVINYLSLSFFMINISLCITMQTFVSRSYGAGDYQQVLRSFYFSFKVSAAVSLMIYLFIAWQGRSLAGLFVNDLEMIEMIYQGFLIYGIGFGFLIFSYLATIFLTALHQPLPSLVIALCENLIFILIALLVLPSLLGSVGVWASLPVAECLALAVSVPLFLKQRKRLKLKRQETTCLRGQSYP